MEHQPGTSDVDLLVGDWLEALRTSRVMSLRELASRTAIDDGWLAAVETGWGSATLTELCQIAGALGVDLLTILLPILGHGLVPPPRPIDHASWVLELNRHAHGIRDTRALTLLLKVAVALREREIEG